MLFGKLEAWVTDATGEEKLTEYVRRRVEKNTVECWIPSTEGACFGIKFKHADPVPQRSKFGLEFNLYFDGVEVFEYYYLPSEVNEYPTYHDAKYTAETIRSFQFGRLQLTDKETLAPVDDPMQLELNTIKMTFQWITGFEPVAQKRTKKAKKKKQSLEDDDSDSDADPAPKPENQKARYVHEQIAKKLAHSGSAVLGPPTRRESASSGNKGKVWTYDYADKDPVSFVFRYAPKEWLQDKGIIRSAVSLPVPQINTIDGEDITPPQRIPSPPPSPLFYQPKAEPDSAVPDLTNLCDTESNINGTDAGGSSTVPPDILEPKQEPSLFIDQAATEGTGNENNIVNPPESPLVPQKRSREPAPTCVIDVDELSSDDEIILLEVRPSKDVKRARIDQYESQVVKSEVQDVKPRLEAEGTKPKTEDIKPSLEVEYTTDDSVVDLWRLGC
ncbi:hypothetical protein BDV93DRAFT_604230 [Ceratobasidium sp. AG-I]|nr:hypothetical protein BDV93DRAFT_604230 [Ceratobasidium sp. AG-I]